MRTSASWANPVSKGGRDYVYGSGGGGETRSSMHNQIDLTTGRKKKEGKHTFQRPAIGRVAANDDLPPLPRRLDDVLLSHHRPVREGEFPTRWQVLDRGHHLHRIPRDAALDQTGPIPLDHRQYEIGTKASRSVAFADDVPHARHTVGHRGRVDGYVVVSVAVVVVAVVGGPHDLPDGSAVGGLGMIVRGIYIPTAFRLAEIPGWLRVREMPIGFNFEW